MACVTFIVIVFCDLIPPTGQTVAIDNVFVIFHFVGSIA